MNPFDEWYIQEYGLEAVEFTNDDDEDGCVVDNDFDDPESC